MKKRAGRRNRRKGRWLLIRFWRDRAKVLLVFGLITLGVMVVVTVFIPEPHRPLMTTLVLAGVAFTAGWLSRFDPGRTYRDGAFGEEQTSRALRKLKREGWRVVDEVSFEGMDVDHVLVGSGGVFAVESKWTSGQWVVTPSGIENAIGDVLGQARTGARKIRLLLQAGGIRVRVAPLVVVWGPAVKLVPEGMEQVEDVLVAVGAQATEWRGRLNGSALETEEMQRIMAVLESFVEERDAYEWELRAS